MIPDKHETRAERVGYIIGWALGWVLVAAAVLAVVGGFIYLLGFALSEVLGR